MVAVVVAVLAGVGVAVVVGVLTEAGVVVAVLAGAGVVVAGVADEVAVGVVDFSSTLTLASTAEDVGFPSS